MMNFNAQYDIIDCIMNHEYRVKYSRQGVPETCRACEPKQVSETDFKPAKSKAQRPKVREFSRLGA